MKRGKDLLKQNESIPHLFSAGLDKEYRLEKEGFSLFFKFDAQDLMLELNINGYYVFIYPSHQT